MREKKDIFDEMYNAWKYSIRSFTVDDENIRVIVSFDSDDLLIITIINLDSKR